MNSGQSGWPGAGFRSDPDLRPRPVLIGQWGLLLALLEAQWSLPTAVWTSLWHIVVSVKYN